MDFSTLFAIIVVAGILYAFLGKGSLKFFSHFFVLLDGLTDLFFLQVFTKKMENQFRIY